MYPSMASSTIRRRSELSMFGSRGTPYLPASGVRSAKQSSGESVAWAMGEVLSAGRRFAFPENDHLCAAESLCRQAPATTTM
jgi:hypothetical protein